MRGQRVLLDVDLAQVYGVTTKRLNEQVRRNSDRFPPDFLIQLTKLAQELEGLKQSVAVLDADTRRQFDQVYEAILGLMATSPRKQ